MIALLFALVGCGPTNISATGVTLDWRSEQVEPCGDDNYTYWTLPNGVEPVMVSFRRLYPNGGVGYNAVITADEMGIFTIGCAEGEELTVVYAVEVSDE